MTLAHSRHRILAALEGCYEADRAAALAGVPKSTVYYWARTGVVVPTVSPERPKRWSYADLMALRIVQWLRKPKTEPGGDVPGSPMTEVRRALAELDQRGIDLWAAEYDGPSSPLRVNRAGAILIVTASGTETPYGEQVMEGTLDLLGPFGDGLLGPDLLRPRPLLRIVPGKLSGEPHIAHTRITSESLAALSRRGHRLDSISALYPDQEPLAIKEALDLERQLAA